MQSGEAGGKGYNLYLLSQQGMAVPKFAVMGAQYFKEFRMTHGLDEKFGKILEEAQAEGGSLAKASEDIKKLIMDCELPADIAADARKAYQHVGSELIAVRSSATDEDSAQFSFAGQLSSFLFVSSEDDALEFLKECWASGYTERGLHYRIQNDISLEEGVNVAVVFQEMIDSEISGVMFTCDPISRDPEKYVINAVYGVGEGLVSGALDADTFHVSKYDGKVLLSEVVKKESKFLQKAPPEKGLTEAPVAEELQEKTLFG